MWFRSSWLALQYIHIRIWLGRRLYNQKLNGKRTNIIRTSPWSVIKRDASRSEYIALKMLQDHSTIKVPRLRGAVYQHYKNAVAEHDVCHIVMEYVPGKSLAQAWRRLSAAHKQAIAKEHHIVQDLRHFKPPLDLAGRVTSLEGGITCCTGISGAGGIHEDFKTYDLFLNWWFEMLDWKQKNWIDLPYDVDALKASLNAPDVRNVVVFTHGDLQAKNILVDTERGSIRAVIDWEMAGWMPIYWEHFKALYPRSDFAPRRWQEFVETAFGDEHADAFAAVVTVYKNSGFR